MGFYSTMCMITGVNLRNSVETAVVLLHRTPAGQYSPISLGIHGIYDGFGSIDWVPEDLNASLLTRFFTAAHRAGRFEALDQTQTGDYDWFDPAIDIETLLFLVERTVSSSDLYDAPHPPGTVLDGDPVVFAMIAQSVWDGIASQPRSHPTDLTPAVFGPGAGVAADIYGERLGELVEPVRQFVAVSEFIAARPSLRWAPPNETVQRFALGSGHHFEPEQNAQFVEDARREYRGVSFIQNALDVYVRDAP